MNTCRKGLSKNWFLLKMAEKHGYILDTQAYSMSRKIFKRVSGQWWSYLILVTKRNVRLQHDHGVRQIIYMVQTAHVNSLPVSYTKGKTSPGVETISTWKK